MKVINGKARLLSLFLLFFIPTNAQTKPVKRNKLERLEVSHSDIGVQLLFDFVRNTTIKPHFNKSTQTLTLFFPELLPHEIGNHSNWKQLLSLQTTGFFKNIELAEQAEKPRGSILKIDFPSHIQTKNTVKKNELLIKWSTVETRGTRLIINAISKQALETIRKHGATILYATNDVIQSDFSTTLQGLKKSKSPSRRIIIDAGHGGIDSGAKGFNNLLEKDIALQVSKLLAAKLKAAGYNAHLTRSDDRNIPLVKRSNLANQLKADAFISIHLNSGGADTRSAGIETYYLAKKGVLPPSLVGGYYFVNTEYDQKLVEAANNRLNRKIESSKVLASCVQNELIKTLHKSKMPTKNRGVRSQHLRLLLHNNVPTALVEIGFITNPQEAKRLNSTHRQEIIANGILCGVKKFFDQTK